MVDVNYWQIFKMMGWIVVQVMKLLAKLRGHGVGYDTSDKI